MLRNSPKFRLFSPTMEDYFIDNGKDFNLILPAFSHEEPLHLLGNMFYLWLALFPTVSELGPEVTLALYLLSGIFSSLYSRRSGGLGASGAITGITGFAAATTLTSGFKEYKWTLVYLLMDCLGQVLVAAVGILPKLVYDLIGNVDMDSHVGGLLIGFCAWVATISFAKNKQKSQ